MRAAYSSAILTHAPAPPPARRCAPIGPRPGAPRPVKAHLPRVGRGTARPGPARAAACGGAAPAARAAAAASAPAAPAAPEPDPDPAVADDADMMAHDTLVARCAAGGAGAPGPLDRAPPASRPPEPQAPPPRPANGPQTPRYRQRSWYFLSSGSQVFFLPYLSLFLQRDLGFDPARVGCGGASGRERAAKAPAGAPPERVPAAPTRRPARRRLLQGLRPWLSAPSSLLLCALADRFGLHRAALIAGFVTSVALRGALALAPPSLAAVGALLLAAEVVAAPVGVIADASVVARCKADGDYGKQRCALAEAGQAGSGVGAGRGGVGAARRGV
jgi:hypothetical protein